MLIQTLVENAIKHGIGKLVKGGHISINCLADETELNLKIVNSGQYSPAEDTSNESASGFGIENSRQRLDFIFGNKANFEIKNLNENEVITKLKIPKT